MIKYGFVFALAIVSLNACPGLDERCAACQGNQCKVCFEGYINAQGKCQKPAQLIEHCLEYVNETTCKFCQHEYFVNT